MVWHIKREWGFPWPALVQVPIANGLALLSFLTNGYAGAGTITNLDQSLGKTSGAQNANARPRTPETGASKFYCEFEASNSGAYQVGVAEHTALLAVTTAVVGTADDTAGIPTNSTAFKVENVTIATFAGAAGTTRVRVACDPGNRLLWLAIGSGSWNNDGSADPATGTNGASLAGFSSNFIMPACGATGTPGGTVTLYSRSTDWTFAAPSGFTAYPIGRPGFLNVPAIVGIDNSTTVAVNYPTTAGAIQSNDFLVLALSSDVVGSFFTTPTGWTAFEAELVNGSSLNTKLFWKRADGTETGTLNCVQSQAGAAGNCFAGSMMRFNNVITSGLPYESFSSAARAAATTFTGLTVTPTATNRLGVTIALMGNDGFVLGDDGGNWTDVAALVLTRYTTAGNDAGHVVFIADPTAGDAFPALQENGTGLSVEGNVYAFALIPTPGADATRVTQAFLEVPYRVLPAVNVTQAFAEVPYSVADQSVRVTQAFLEVVYKV